MARTVRSNDYSGVKMDQVFSVKSDNSSREHNYLANPIERIAVPKPAAQMTHQPIMKFNEFGCLKSRDLSSIYLPKSNKVA